MGVGREAGVGRSGSDRFTVALSTATWVSPVRTCTLMSWGPRSPLSGSTFQDQKALPSTTVRSIQSRSVYRRLGASNRALMRAKIGMAS